MIMDLVLLGIFVMCCVASSANGIGNSQSVYNVVSYGAKGDGKTDDTQAFEKAWQALCGAPGGGTLVIPASRSFLLKVTVFSGPCKSNSLYFQVAGKITAPGSIGGWGGGCRKDLWNWISFNYIDDLSIYGLGTIDGQGSDWWQHAGIEKCTRPRALQFHSCNNLKLSGLTHLNSPGSHISVNDCNGVFFSNLNIYAPEDSPNTDGIDISSSTHVTIAYSNIGTGDDCVAINGGCSSINITHVSCGPGHGISVGSLGEHGEHDTVEGVHVSNCHFNGTQNGARIKTWAGGSGFAKGITFEQITLVAAGNPIIIDQHYCPGHSCRKDKPQAVAISDVTYIGFQGTSADEQAITLDCASIGCTNIKTVKVNITSSVPSKQIRAFCSNAHGTSNSTVPTITCLSG